MSLMVTWESGYRNFVHIPRDERFKHDKRSKQSVSVGYSHKDFVYRLWHPLDNKIIRSRDVVFLED